MALISFNQSGALLWRKDGDEDAPVNAPRLVGFDGLSDSDAPETLALHIDTETSFAALADIPDALAGVAIDFPKFNDGRGFSLAVRLRKDFAYRGEIRAIGHVIPDQALFLLRAGFDSAEVPPQRLDAFAAALKRFPAFYQTDVRGQISVAHRRHTARATAAE
ncbi:DUF934 domain-containing protein [Eilatimonas milleporae]|uniref:Uncharacterized protein DUF934 n=1 Tax=Eilatimonas milleporae TaxID=911205 RepID=A0A3M0C2P7_9PROT|nr:DUF934 domain-containing protein [Eilatimonas milleporae]RMB02640.1 uncharacterized protein DUF934 [Eilatimonas milleporae]